MKNIFVIDTVEVLDRIMEGQDDEQTLVIRRKVVEEWVRQHSAELTKLLGEAGIREAADEAIRAAVKELDLTIDADKCIRVRVTNSEGVREFMKEKWVNATYKELYDDIYEFKKQLKERCRGFLETADPKMMYEQAIDKMVRDGTKTSEKNINQIIDQRIAMFLRNAADEPRGEWR